MYKPNYKQLNGGANSEIIERKQTGQRCGRHFVHHEAVQYREWIDIRMSDTGKLVKRLLNLDLNEVLRFYRKGDESVTITDSEGYWEQV